MTDRPGHAEHLDFPDTTTLGEVRAYLRQQAMTDGARCPACTQVCRVYRRKLNAAMSRLLILIYRDHGQSWVHSRTIGDGTGDLAKLRYWDLIEESAARRVGGGHTGRWQITDRGVAFIHRRITVPAYALIYDGQLLELDGDPIGVRDALGERFDLAELLAEPSGVEPDLRLPTGPEDPR